MCWQGKTWVYLSALSIKQKLIDWSIDWSIGCMNISSRMYEALLLSLAVHTSSPQSQSTTPEQYGGWCKRSWQPKAIVIHFETTTGIVNFTRSIKLRQSCVVLSSTILEQKLIDWSIDWLTAPSTIGLLTLHNIKDTSIMASKLLAVSRLTLFTLNSGINKYHISWRYWSGSKRESSKLW